MVRVALIFDRIRWEEKALLAAARELNVDMIPIDAKDVFFEITSDGNLVCKGADVALQRCVSYFRGLHIAAILETFSLRVVNPFQVSLICGNKLLTTLALVKAGVPTPMTFVAFSVDGAMRALNKLGLPAVLKPIIGSWGRMVSPLTDFMSSRALFETMSEMGPLYKIFYIQDMINKPQRDIRTFVIGDEVVAAIYRYAKEGEWRTNTARGGRAVPCPLTDELVDISLKAANAVGGGVLGVDIMESENGLLVHEVNSTIEFKNTVPVTGVNIPGLIIRYVKDLVRR